MEYKSAKEYIESKKFSDFHKKNKENKIKNRMAKKMGSDNYGSKATRAKYSEEQYNKMMKGINSTPSNALAKAEKGEKQHTGKKGMTKEQMKHVESGNLGAFMRTYMK